MQLLLNITLAWFSVGLMAALSIIYLLRVVNKSYFNSANPTIKWWHQKLRKPHIWLGLAAIATGAVHGLLSSTSIFSFNLGTLLLLVLIALGLTFALRKKMRKPKHWILAHRGLTLVAILLVAFHIVEVGGLVGISPIIAALESDLQGPSVASPLEAALYAKTTASTMTNSTADSSTNSTTQTTTQTLPSTEAMTTTQDPTTTQATTSQATTAATQGPYKDGTYTGTANAYRPGLTVEVVIENGLIASVEVVDHNEKGARYYARPIELIPQEIVAAQSTDVDAVSGATFTSRGIMKAVENALANALK